MNQRIAKEIRLLLPLGIGGAAILVLIPQVLESIGLNLSGASFIFFFICAVLGIASFGRDVAGDTLSQMLSQPLLRSVLWKEKILVSGLFLTGFTIIFHFVLLPHLGESFRYYFGDGFFIVGMVFPVFAFCVGPLLVLITRQITASFWLLILSSGIVVLIVALIGEWLSLKPEAEGVYVMTVLPLVFAGLSIAAFIQARKRFLNYEDTSSFSREITLSLGRFLPFLKAKEAAAQQSKNSTWALFKKELHLQQVNFVFILGCYVVLFLHQMILAPGIIEADGGLTNNQYIPDGIASAVRIVAGIAPFVIGAVAIAEERRYGVEEWHLMLPASRLKQWTVKLFTCLVLSFLLGGGFIFVVDWLANHFPASVTLHKFGEIWMDVTPFQNFLYYVVFPIIALSLGMMASSAARNYLQALSIQMGIGISVFMISVLAIWFMDNRFYQLADPNQTTTRNIYLIIGLPLFLITALVLSYRNFAGLGRFQVD